MTYPEIKPYKNASGDKKEQVKQMFDNISDKYDFLNHFLSLGIDKLWRKKIIHLMKPNRPTRILDVATGTGDLLLLQAQKLRPKRLVGLDLSEAMLERARQKLERHHLNAELVCGDAENMPFKDHSFDAVTVAFGIRNFGNLEKGLSEMARVLAPGGKAYILEFSQPHKAPFKQLYGFYAHHILPALGKIFSGDASAYAYLPESIRVFPYGKQMTNILRKTGFEPLQYIPLTFGVATVYIASKA